MRYVEIYDEKGRISRITFHKGYINERHQEFSYLYKRAISKSWEKKNGNDGPYGLEKLFTGSDEIGKGKTNQINEV
jgi:hypothetical protein